MDSAVTPAKSRQLTVTDLVEIQGRHRTKFSSTGHEYLCMDCDLVLVTWDGPAEGLPEFGDPFYLQTIVAGRVHLAEAIVAAQNFTTTPNQGEDR